MSDRDIRARRFMLPCPTCGKVVRVRQHPRSTSWQFPQHCPLVLDQAAIQAARSGRPIPWRSPAPSDEQLAAEWEAAKEFKRALELLTDEQWEASRARQTARPRQEVQR